MSGLVIVADSDPLTLQRRAAGLEMAGRRVLARPLGRPLIDALNVQALDAVVIGFASGADVDFGLCRAVRSHAEAPMLLIAPTATIDVIESALGAGADDFIVAPSNDQVNRRVMMWRRPELRDNLQTRRRAAIERVAAEKASGGGVTDLGDLLGGEIDSATPAIDMGAADLAAIPEDAGFFDGLSLEESEPEPPKPVAKSNKSKPEADDDDTERVWG